MKRLTQAKRDQARQRARRSIERRIGEKPKREQFNRYVASKYPWWFRAAIAGMLLVVAVAAGFISGVRLYLAGYNHAGEIVSIQWVRALIGVSTFSAAEILVIVGTVAGQVYLRRWWRLLSIAPVLVGVIVAGVGNWHITDPHTMWGWVETSFPPLAVLSVAFFFEVTLIPELERREADQRAYDKAVFEWERAKAELETHPEFEGAFKQALCEELQRVNKIHFDDLEPDQWIMLVGQEWDVEQIWNSDGIPSEQGKRSKAKRSVRRGLVDSVEGDLSQAEKTVAIFRQYPELADRSVTPVHEATEQLGVGNSTYYKALQMYDRNGSHSKSSE